MIFTPMIREENHSELESYLHLKMVCDKYNIPFIEDLYHDDDLMKKELFKDPAHFNNDGATLFSNKLADKISTILNDNQKNNN